MPRATKALIGLAPAVMAFGFQQTGVIPAIPEIRRSLHASATWSAWLQTGYLVAACILTPVTGKLADRAGKRRLLLAALGTFLAGSIGAAVAPTLGWLIAFRIVQGGGGAVFPLTLAIVRDTLDGERIAAGIGLLTGAFGLGTAAGFAGAGAIVQAAGWRWLFWSGAAVVGVAMLVVAATVPREPGRSPSGLDLPGTALLTGGLGAILVALTEGSVQGWGSPWVIGGFVAGVALLGGWIAYDARVEEPLLDLAVLTRRTVLLANLSTIGLGFALFGCFFLVPFLVQRGFGADTFQTGLYLLPAAVGQLGGGPLAPRLARRLSAKWVYVLGLGLTAGSAAGLALAHGAAGWIVAWTLVLGIGAGLAIGIGSDVVAEAVEAHESGIATSFNSVLRRLGGGIGGQVAAALLTGVAAAQAAFAAAFWAIAGVAALAALVAAGIRTGEARPAASRAGC